MAVPFSRTLQSLSADREPWRYAALTMLLAFPAAVIWVLYAQVPVYEVSAQARLERVTEPQVLAAAVEGTVAESRLYLGQPVARGDVLVILRDEDVRRNMDELREKMVSTRSHLEDTRRRMALKQREGEGLARSWDLQVQQSQTRLEIARKQQERAEQFWRRMSDLRNRDAVAADEVEAAESQVEQARKLVKAEEIALAQAEQDRRNKEHGFQAERERLEEEERNWARELQEHDATQRRLQYDLELRTIRAYVDGTVGQLEELGEGRFVHRGEKLATIVPVGEIRIVARLPAVAVGRIQRGQPSRLRLDGFPWTQYGTLPAKVTGHGNVTSDDGLIEVDLAVTPSPRVPMTAGQTGSVEIEVERVSPAHLMLRAAGEYLMTRRPATGH